MYIYGTVSISDRNITKLRLADYIDTLAEEEQELESLVESLDKTCTWYNNGDQSTEDQTGDKQRHGFQREVKVKGQKQGTLLSLKYLGAVV